MRRHVVSHSIPAGHSAVNTAQCVGTGGGLHVCAGCRQGLSTDGLPLVFQLVCNRLDEELLCQLQQKTLELFQDLFDRYDRP